MKQTDVLVVGSGIAGLFLAIKVAKNRPDLTVTIMVKDTAAETNTRYAQGGIAGLLARSESGFEEHVQDTLAAGGGICDEEVVRMVVQQAPERLRELIALGVDFDRDASGDFNLALEGGHTKPRILHCADCTGAEIEQALLRALKSLPNIIVLENHFAESLVVKQNICLGVRYIDAGGRYQAMAAGALVLCTGGCGQLFARTTNASIATADGVAMAHRAGAGLAGMEYIQFHPTALYEPGKSKCFLLTEALRGFGAHLLDEKGKRFMFKYDTRGELATRDVVSAAIRAEMKRSNAAHVYLDCRHIAKEAFTSHFKTIYDYCTSVALDPQFTLLPVAPVAHYQCGGVVVDTHARTSVKKLYAVGECAHTGLHGSNRLASNSLLEAVVYAHQAAEAICSGPLTIQNIPAVAEKKTPSAGAERIRELHDSLRQMMDDAFLDRESFNRVAFTELVWEIEFEYGKGLRERAACELSNMALAATLIVNALYSAPAAPALPRVRITKS